MTQIRNSLFLFLIFIFLILFTFSCEKTDFVIPNAQSFQIVANISGKYSYSATITEKYAEFSGSFLMLPIRYENGEVTCGDLTVPVKVGETSLFALPQILSVILIEGDKNAEIIRKNDSFIYEFFVSDKKITAEISQETLLPTKISYDEYVIEIIEINITYSE